jgi:hypothetical protein
MQEKTSHEFNLNHAIVEFALAQLLTKLLAGTRVTICHAGRTV